MIQCYQCDQLVDEINYRSRCPDCQQLWLDGHKKIIVAGGRTFNDYELMATKLEYLLSNQINKQNAIMIISGTAGGADRLGERYAKEQEFELLKMPANWDKYGKSAGYKRNHAMACLADGVVVFWDGKSRGSKHMINIAAKRELPMRIVPY
jgi:predicted Rossmann fold nucleotide-binding protein DprA/Smf involved in DNA uptake